MPIKNAHQFSIYMEGASIITLYDDGDSDIHINCNFFFLKKQFNY